jgi:hypothetical protein
VLDGQVCSTVFSIRQGIAPAGSFVCESLLHPGLAGSKYVEIAVQKIPFFIKYLFSRVILGYFFRAIFG